MTGQERIYVGNAKKITTQYGELMKLSITAEDIEKMRQNLNNGWVNIVIKERKTPSAGGMTHYLEIDTWKPQKQTENQKNPSSSEPDFLSEDDFSPEDLPF